MGYIHELAGWPELAWDAARLAPLLAEVRHRQGRLIGRMEGLGFSLRSEASLSTLTTDVVKSSAIEGEILDVDQVRSSIARKLGLNVAGIGPASRDVEGIVEMMLDATQRYAEPLTDGTLLQHVGTDRSRAKRILPATRTRSARRFGHHELARMVP